MLECKLYNLLIYHPSPPKNTSLEAFWSWKAVHGVWKFQQSNVAWTEGVVFVFHGFDFLGSPKSCSSPILFSFWMVNPSSQFGKKWWSGQTLSTGFFKLPHFEALRPSFECLSWCHKCWTHFDSRTFTEKWLTANCLGLDFDVVGCWPVLGA